MQENRLLNFEQINEMKAFINDNLYLIYQYINTQILNGIGEINYNFFIKIIQDIFTENTNIKFCKYNKNLMPYLLFTLISENGRMDYTSLRTDTINFNQMNKEAKIYYNYVQFSLKDEFLFIELMQMKMGGMPINRDIVKFVKKIPIKVSGLEEFINLNKSSPI